MARTKSSIPIIPPACVIRHLINADRILGTHKLKALHYRVSMRRAR
jgi:hypothetical protein